MLACSLSYAELSSLRKMPLIISVAGVQQHLFWFYPQQPFEEMCETLSAMLKEIPVTCDSVPA